MYTCYIEINMSKGSDIKMIKKTFVQKLEMLFVICVLAMGIGIVSLFYFGTKNKIKNQI